MSQSRLIRSWLEGCNYGESGHVTVDSNQLLHRNELVAVRRQRELILEIYPANDDRHYNRVRNLVLAAARNQHYHTIHLASEGNHHDN